MARLKDPEKAIAIYNAALNIFSRSGDGSFTISEVAKEADIASGTIYLYFENKEDLINQLYLHLSDRLFSAITKSMVESDNFFSIFRTIWYNHFNFLMENQPVSNYLEQYGKSKLLTDQTKLTVQSLSSTIVKQLNLAQSQFLIKGIHAEIILASILGSTHHIVRFLSDKNTVPSARELEDYFEMAWNSIRR